MCCVIPPASPAVTQVLRMASRREVFSVVDVTHDGYYGRSGGEIFWIIFVVGYAEFEGGIFRAVILLTKGVLR